MHALYAERKSFEGMGQTIFMGKECKEREVQPRLQVVSWLACGWGGVISRCSLVRSQISIFCKLSIYGKSAFKKKNSSNPLAIYNANYFFLIHFYCWGYYLLSVSILYSSVPFSIEIFSQSWLGSKVGSSIFFTCQRCRFHPQSGQHKNQPIKSINKNKKSLKKKEKKKEILLQM